MPGVNRNTNLEREMYQEWLVRMGFEKHSNTDLVDSPEAKFRRLQIQKYKDSGQSAADTMDYGK